jgi:hypothetical protein
MALTTYERIRGALAGVGNSGDRILEDVKQLREFAKHVPDGPERKLFDLCLKSIEAQAEQLQTKDE